MKSRTLFSIAQIIITTLIASCGSGSGGSSTNPAQPTGTSSEDQQQSNYSGFSFTTSEEAVVNLSDAELLLEHSEVVSTAPNFVIEENPIRIISTGNSNLLAITSDGDLYNPVSNIEPLFVEYSAISPDRDYLYLYVEQDYYQKRGLPDDLYLQDDQSYTYSLPLIGPEFQANTPISYSNFYEVYPGGYPRFINDSSNNSTCSNGAIDEYGNCYVSIEISTGNNNENFIINLKDFYDDLQSLLLKKYFYCSLLKVSIDNSEVSCLGGLEESIAEINIMGKYFPIKVMKQKLAEDEHQSISLYEKIRPGLSPIQFDDAGNVYVASREYQPTTEKWITAQVTKISHNQTTSTLLNSETALLQSYVVAASGRIFAKISGQNSGIFLIQNETAIKLASENNNYVADDGESIIIGRSYFSSLPDGGYAKAPVIWKGQQSFSMNYTFSNEGYLYTCDHKDRLLRILPYNEIPYLGSQTNCEENLIYQGHRIITKTIAVDNNGTTDVIHIENLATGQVYEVLASTDYQNEDRYSVRKLMIVDNKIFFDAQRSNNNAGPILGKISFDDLLSGQSEAEYLELIELSGFTTSVSSINRISKFTNSEITEDTTFSVQEIMFDDYEPSQVGIKFSKKADKESVATALSVKQGDDDLAYLKIWSNNNLHLIPDSNGWGDSNADGVIDNSDYKSLQPEVEYTVSLDADIAHDARGEYLQSDTARVENSITFKNRTSFYPGIHDSMPGKAAMLRRPSSSLYDPDVYDDDYYSYWNLKWDPSYSKGYYGFRAFKVINLPESINAFGATGRTNYRIEFDYFCDLATPRFGIGIRDASISHTGYYFNNYWQQGTQIRGFSMKCNADGANVYSPGGGFTPTPIALMAHGSMSLRIDSYGSTLKLYVLNTETGDYEEVWTTSAPEITSGEGTLWVAASTYNYAPIDNLRIQHLTSSGTVGETLAESDFEDPINPFGPFTSMTETATDEL
ncbi:MAG: hypothetical protein VW258_10470 [Thalassolituus sp.]